MALPVRRQGRGLRLRSLLRVDRCGSAGPTDLSTVPCISRMALSGKAMLGVLAWKNENHRASRDLDESRSPPNGKRIAIAQGATRMARRGRRARGFISAGRLGFRVHRLRGPGDTWRGNSLVRVLRDPRGIEARRDERISERNRPTQVLER